MTFIVTAGGAELDLRHPSPGHVTIWSIAWSLAQINRFNGHAMRPYSVAEHSLLVCEIAERDLGADLHGQFASLMHDGHEPWSGDMHTPGKHEIGPAWFNWENKWERLVRSCFGMHTAAAAWAKVIKRADLIALATEKRDLLPPTPTTWAVLHDIEPVTWVDLWSPERRAMTWEDWRDRFLDKYHELEFARNEHIFQPRIV